MVFWTPWVGPPQYHSGRRLQHLQSWVSFELSQQHARGQQGIWLEARYRYQAYADFHAIQLITEQTPILLFCDPVTIPAVNGELENMEANVIAGRALLGTLQLPDGTRRCAVFIVQEKVMQGTSRAAAYRASAESPLNLWSSYVCLFCCFRCLILCVG